MNYFMILIVAIQKTISQKVQGHVKFELKADMKLG